MEFSKRTVLALAALALAAAAPVRAQDTRGRIQGMITDTTGGAVAGAAATLQNDATGISVNRESAANGRYLFDQVDPGTYTLTVKQASFNTVVQKNVRVLQRGDVTADVTLKVSDVVETVTVEASPVAVQFNTSDRTISVEGSLFEELPLISRNPATLAALDPSVNGDWTRNANYDHYAANAYDLGGRTLGRNEVLIDGSPLTNSAKLGYNPPVEAVSEYAVRQNAIDAEFGHSAGGVITMSMKSGTNQLHGSAYYFGGTPDWNAMSNRITRQHSQSTSWNGGGTAGFPIIKNKLFLFSTYEKQTDASYQSLAYTLPTALERQGDFSQSLYTDGQQRVNYDPLTSRIVSARVVRDPFPANRIPEARWDRAASLILKNLWNLTLNLNVMDPRLSHKYGAELSRTVANPFYNYGTVETFPGALRRQATVSTATLLKPYPHYGNITQVFTDIGKFRNESAQIRFQRPFRGGFSFMASYAYVLANSMVFYDEVDQYDRVLTKADDPNTRHRIVTTGAFAIPVGRNQAFASNLPRSLDLVIGGWQLSGIYTYRGGQLLQFGAMTAPASVKQLGETGSGKYWFDITGFGRLPAYTRRSNPMYYENLRGPAFPNVDAVLSKKFAIHEKIRPEFRLEAYNAFNKLNWANPTVSITASDFGRTNAPASGNFGRQLRYAVRVEF